MSDWTSIEEFVGFFRNDPAPTHDEALQALQFTSFSSGLFSHMTTFVVNGDIDNPMMFLSRIGVDSDEEEAVMIHITDKQMPLHLANIADWFVSGIAGSPEMHTYTAHATMLHRLRLSFIDEIEPVTLDELSRRYEVRNARRPRVSVQYRRV